jgi:PIN domain nuclease of toxin-antitoxin system
MKFLLDTHTFLWMLKKESPLSDRVRELLRDMNNVLFLSAVSPWEVAIKIGSGRFSLTQEPLAQFFREQMVLTSVRLLQLDLAHIELVSKLPHHHKDPFDRILIAQAITENMAVIGADKVFDAYGVDRLW